MHLFHTTEFSGDLIECNEGDLCWVDIKEVYNLPIWEGDKIFLKLLEEKAPFFSLKIEYVGDTLVNAVLNGEKIA
jgi:8-oxo-dGTP diphosphatase